MKPKKKKSITDQVHRLPIAEVVAYTGTKREIRKKRRQYEGIGANIRHLSDRVKRLKDKRKK